MLQTKGDTLVGNEPGDRVLFHGGNGSGERGEDPGALDASLDDQDALTAQQLAELHNEERRAINVLRDALLAQGLIG